MSEAAKQRDHRVWRLGLMYVAAIAHDGGLAGLSEREALTAIRKLTLPYWKRGGSVDEHERDVFSALSKANNRAEAEND